VPATNSATTAPMSASPLEIRNPPKKYGSALGIRSRHRVCIRPARLMRKRFTRPGSTLRNPSVVLDMIGNNATTVAQTVSATCVFLTRMMINGAIATIGVTCSNTAYGKKLISMARLCTNTNAINVPITIAARNACRATRSVTPSAASSVGQSLASLAAISLGFGNRKIGT
jgi:hypothetical protein